MALFDDAQTLDLRMKSLFLNLEFTQGSRGIKLGLIPSYGWGIISCEAGFILIFDCPLPLCHDIYL